MKLPYYRRSLLQQQTAAVSSTFTSPLGCSWTLIIIIVVLTVIFFFAVFSYYRRRSFTITASDSDLRFPPLNFNKRGGADDVTVRSLPVVPYDGELKMWSECSICLGEFEERETVKVIPYCRHGFHPVCIDTWLSSHVSCPLCRSNRLFPAVDEVRAVADGDLTVVT